VKKKLLLIGWDAADWKVINPMMDSGLLPNLQKLVDQGVSGKLATLEPPLSPMLWTSISTGMRPYKHGIHGFTEPDPSGTGVRPMHINSRKVKALWNIFTQNNIKSNVVAWWPSHPAEPINGNLVSNFFQKAGVKIDEEWPLPKGCVHPMSLNEIISHLRVHPEELTPNHIRPFVPEFDKLDLNNADHVKLLNGLTRITAETASVHNAATYLMENSEWDFSAVYLDGIDHYCHAFMKYHPPKMDIVDQELFDYFKHVIHSAYKYHDLMLGRLMDIAGEDCSIMLISDHGFHPGNLRPKMLPKNEHAAPAMEHSPFGIFVWRGNGIKKDELVHGINLLDIAPTILNYFDLPVGLDVDGKVITTAYEVLPEIKTIDSWENVEGDAGLHTEETIQTKEEAAEALQQLIDLGYIDEASANSDKARELTTEMNDFFLARAYFDGAQYNDALKIFKRLFENAPDNQRYGLRVANTYRILGQMDKLGETLIQIKELIPEDTAGLLLLEAIVLMSNNKNRSAMALLDKAKELEPDLGALNMHIGRAYLSMGVLDKSEEAFLKELEYNPESHQTYNLLGVLYFKRDQHELALDTLLKSVGLMYSNPSAHMHIGICLFHQEEFENAAQAFEVALKLNPNYGKCYNWLYTIYKDKLDQPERANEIMLRAQAIRDKEILVVSGLPRSGTSMMMQMLQAGGVEIFTDDLRKPDENNPRGYYEHEAVKNLPKYKAFLSEVDDKAVKIVADLLSHLPGNYKYKIIFMDRDVTETNLSQGKMLRRLGKSKNENFNVGKNIRLEQTLSKVEHWNRSNPNVEMLNISFTDTINNPRETAEKVAGFLSRTMNLDKMAAVVDGQLYRERVKAS